LQYIYNISNILIKVNIIMENEEKVMTGEESLKIISEMINKNKIRHPPGKLLPALLGMADFCMFPFRVPAKEICRCRTLLLCMASCNSRRICIDDLWIYDRTKSKGEKHIQEYFICGSGSGFLLQQWCCSLYTLKACTQSPHTSFCWQDYPLLFQGS